MVRLPRSKAIRKYRRSTWEPAMSTEAAPILEVIDLNVYYANAHVLQSVSFTFAQGVLAVVGRNGMGKTTLCNAIVGWAPARSGRIRLAGDDILGLEAHVIVERGIGYVPQGRRGWPSLTVDEHFRLAAGSGNQGPWTVQRIYQTFPQLAQRKNHGGAQLSGGEQQMLAISRALLLNPRLLVMDEPSEGLAPVLVEQVVAMLKRLTEEGEIAVLLIEQNLGVATDVADSVAVMVNGRIAQQMPARQLARDKELQQRLLGVRQAAEEEARALPVAAERQAAATVQIYQVRRAETTAVEMNETAAHGGVVMGRAIWSQGNPLFQSPGSDAAEEAPATAEAPGDESKVFAFPVAATVGRAAYVAGTFDTKGRELFFLRNCLERLGLSTVTVDLSTTGKPSPASVGPAEVARFHPRGTSAVFTGDRGSPVAGMALAFERFIVSRRDLGGLISAGGSGGTALATPAMRALAIGVPKVMVSTVASGNVKDYVGPADISMVYSVTDISGINRISERVLSNAAHSLAGMIVYHKRERTDSKPALGLTMFGVTTPCVQAVTKQLEESYDCLVFHATGTGGQSMEKLADSGLLAGVIDVTTTEIADLLVGGIFSAGEGRLDAIVRTRIPYVGSCGALDMVNFGPLESVPAKFSGRNLYQHNPQVTLMRTTAQENALMGEWIAEKLNRMEGPVRFLIPEGGVSLLDSPGQAFHDPQADQSLFSALEANFRGAATRKLVRLPHNINDAAFSDALVRHFRDIVPPVEVHHRPH